VAPQVPVQLPPVPAAFPSTGDATLVGDAQ
jgi:hypothetical protein